MTPHQRLGARIKQLRKERGLTQERVARMLKLHQAAVSRIENGEQQLTAVQLAVLAKAFRMRSVSVFFEERG